MSRLFRPTLRLLQATHATSPVATIPRTKQSTGLTGLAIHPAPFPLLKELYTSTLQLASQIPQGAVYRQSVESITKERLDAVELLAGAGAESDIAAVEEKIGAGVIEEVIVQAQGELKLVGKILEWKAWEELEAPPAAGQWAPFKQTPSTTTAEDLK